MQSISQIDFTKINLTAPTSIGADGKGFPAPFEKAITGDMRFCRILYPKRPPIFTMTATVVECADSQFGMVCLVKPDTQDFTVLESLEELLSPEHACYAKNARAVNWVESGASEVYEHRPTLTDTYQLRLKMACKDNGNWKFETKVRDLDDALDTFTQGARVNITFTPGYYFNCGDNKFGMYLTLKSLDVVVVSCFEAPPTGKNTTTHVLWGKPKNEPKPTRMAIGK